MIRNIFRSVTKVFGNLIAYLKKLMINVQKHFVAIGQYLDNLQ